MTLTIYPKNKNSAYTEFLVWARPTLTPKHG